MIKAHREKLKQLDISDNEFRDLTLRLGCPMLINNGCLRIALTGFEKSQHSYIVESIKERLDYIFSLRKNDTIIKTFKNNNIYCF